MNYLLSVVIPTFNEEEFVPNLLNDLRNQTNQNFEVLVIDGQSNDATKKKVLKFYKHLNIRFIESSKTHLAYQKNLGANKAQGRYIFFLDADSRLGPDEIAKLLIYLKKNNGAVYIPFIAPLKKNIINRILFFFTINFVMILHKFNLILSLGPIVVFEKKVFHEIGEFDERLYASEDHNIIIRAHKARKKIIFLPDIVCIFSMRRFETQGYLKVLAQYFVFVVQTLLFGGVYSRSIKYKMGGQSYRK